jgi:hypothetical protein
VAPLYLRNRTALTLQGEIAATGIAGGAQCLFTPPSPFGKAEPGAPGHWQIKGLLARPGGSLSRILLFTDTLPGRRCLSITLVRDYRPL